MKPVNQTKFANEGNCYAACLASILEISLDEVPDFEQGTLLLKIDRWLRNNHNCTLMGFKVHDKDDFYCIPAIHHIMAGPASRGFFHAVVGFQGEMVHDPHPSGKGLTEVKDYEFLFPAEVKNENNTI